MRAGTNKPLYLRLKEPQFAEVLKTLSLEQAKSYSNVTVDFYFMGKLLILITQLCSIYIENSNISLFSTPDKDEAFMRSIAMIHERYNESLTIGELARVANLSKSSFVRRFVSICRIPPNEYLNKIRLEVATGLLKNSNCSLSVIAEKTGFYDLSHFSRFFKRKMGLSPSEYRASLRLK